MSPVTHSRLPTLARSGERFRLSTPCAAAILSRSFAPGQRLNVHELAAGARRQPHARSRTRSTRLEAEALIEIRPRSGTFVTAMSPDDVAEAFDIRCALECLAAEKALAPRHARRRRAPAQRSPIVIAEPGDDETARLTPRRAQHRVPQAHRRALGQQAAHADVREPRCAHSDRPHSSAAWRLEDAPGIRARRAPGRLSPRSGDGTRLRWSRRSRQHISARGGLAGPRSRGTLSRRSPSTSELHVVMTAFAGIFPIVNTTFHDDGRLDLESQRRLVRFLIDSGRARPRALRQRERRLCARRR